RAWRQRHQLRSPAATRVWLFQIAANIWRDRLRRSRSPVARAGSIEGNELARTYSPDKLACDQDQLKQALVALDSLPARQREVLYLNACEEMNSADIADVLEISPDAVKANLSLARKRMRELCYQLETIPANEPVQ